MADNKKYGLYAFALIIALSAAAIYFATTRRGLFIKKMPASSAIILPAPPKDTLPIPATMQWLADSTHVFLIKDAGVIPVKKYPVQREVKLDGDVFFDVPDASEALTIRTKLLVLSVTGKAAFLVMAPSAEEWAEVQVISGVIIVRKAYPSQFNEPDTLHDNQMLMINRTIDLMEKEKFETTDLKSWRSRLP